MQWHGPKFHSFSFLITETIRSHACIANTMEDTSPTLEQPAAPTEPAANAAPTEPPAADCVSPLLWARFFQRMSRQTWATWAIWPPWRRRMPCWRALTLGAEAEAFALHAKLWERGVKGRGGQAGGSHRQEDPV